MTNIQLHDSSSNMWKESETEIDCVVADLPWGVNSIEYVEENSRILKSVRARLSTGTLARLSQGIQIQIFSQIPTLKLSVKLICLHETLLFQKGGRKINQK